METVILEGTHPVDLRLIDFLKLISITITGPTIYLAILVVIMWAPSAWKFITQKGGPSTREEWFIVGVFVSFIGQALDNLYWGVAWTMNHMDYEHAKLWFDFGFLPNIPFRMGAGIIAAFCHIKAMDLSLRSDGTTDESAKRFISDIIITSVLIATITFIFFK